MPRRWWNHIDLCLLSGRGTGLLSFARNTSILFRYIAADILLAYLILEGVVDYESRLVDIYGLGRLASTNRVLNQCLVALRLNNTKLLLT